MTTGSGFEGFKMTYDYHPTATDDKFTDDWTKLEEELGFAPTMTVAGGTVGPTTISCIPGSANPALNQCWANEHPLSHQSGTMIVKIKDLQDAGGVGVFDTEWAVGLCRASQVEKSDSPFPGKYLGIINRQKQQPPRIAGDQMTQNDSFDYAVVCQANDDGNNYLDIQQFSVNGVGGGANLGMTSLMYYNNAAGDFPDSIWTPPFTGAAGARYNMTNNIQDFDHLRFSINNEIVTIEIMSELGGPVGGAAAGQYYKLVEFNAANPKVSNPKPAGQTCWNLYPKVRINAPGKSCEITAFEGRNITNAKSVNAGNDDYYLRMMESGVGTGQNGIIKMIDGRSFNRPYDGQTPAQQYVQLGTTDGGLNRILTGYEMAVILSPDTVNYIWTPGANMKLKLGFLGRNILDTNAGTRTLQKMVYDSDVSPNLIDFSSLFVRLDNFTQTSFNARISRPSKILYHLPRFDTSNRELGAGLYFEPSERVYITLNNTDEIPVNEFHLSLCDSKETISKGLTGQTIIGLHIRPSQTPLK